MRAPLAGLNLYVTVAAPSPDVVVLNAHAAVPVPVTTKVYAPPSFMFAKVISLAAFAQLNDVVMALPDEKFTAPVAMEPEADTIWHKT